MPEARSSNARVLLVDDHPVVTDALAMAFLATRTFEGVDKVRSLGEAVALLRTDPDFGIVILDLHMSDSEGVEAVAGLRESHPDIPLLVFSGDSTVETITAAFDLGVRGYATKDVSLEVVIGAVRMVMAGSVYIPPQAMGLLENTSNGSIPTPPHDALASLTPRQKQVLDLLLVGMPNKVIGNRLGMAEGTVKTHLNTIFRVLGARNRAQVILRVRAFGLI